jgi:mRNA interferase RelE/StbE
MDYKAAYTEKAQKDLAKLGKTIAKRILEKLSFFLEQKDPLAFAKKLQNTKDEYWRFRVGDYRMIFKLDQETNCLVILVILKIGHRKEIYNKEAKNLFT